MLGWSFRFTVPNLKFPENPENEEPVLLIFIVVLREFGNDASTTISSILNVLNLDSWQINVFTTPKSKLQLWDELIFVSPMLAALNFENLAEISII
jgi:hypothetical protein